TADDPTSTAAGSGPIADLAQQRAGSAPALKALWTSDLIPFGPHAIRTDLPPEARAALADSLLNMKSMAPEAYDVVEPQFEGGFVMADPADFSRFSELLSSIEVPR
ncbi:MAG: PhnD/SsuA/transferrin family substrate-binding protein, partial [Rhizobiales bacterium]|nr:PhnD/SsuA/transferrin family substrate-binding protein [Hyphomicrobiales bacterium]